MSAASVIAGGIHVFVTMFLAVFILIGVSLTGCTSAGDDSAGSADLQEGEYIAPQIDLVLDGDLSEWSDVPGIPLDQFKDAGVGAPDPEDFEGYARIAWKAGDPSRLYFAYEVTDDDEQYHIDVSRWWFNDTAELIIQDGFGNLVQWAFSADGKTVYSSSGEPEPAEWIVVRDGNRFVFEIAVDLERRGFNAEEVIEETGSLLATVQYNDGGREIRIRQMGWRRGDTWTVSNLMVGNLI